MGVAALSKSIIRNEKGQAAIEYVLLLSAVIFFAALLSRGLRESGISTRIMTRLQNEFRYAYQYGHPEARGMDDPDGPKMHPRILGETASGNFRIFLNPRGL